MTGIYEKMVAVQTQLKAPKNLFNSFGKYKYRNLEGICEAVKPLLKKHGLVLVMYDSIEEHGDRIYVRADVIIADAETKESVTGRAYARESLTKKGMDDSQITGTASSYARKYALSGLFLLDDTKDADTDEYHNITTKAAKKKEEEPERDFEAIKDQPIGKTRALAFNNRLKAEGVTASFVCGHYGINKLSEMTEEMLYDANKNMKQLKKGQDELEANK